MEENPWGDAQAAVERALFGLYEYDELKEKKKTLKSVQLHEVRDCRLAIKESYLLLGRT